MRNIVLSIVIMSLMVAVCSGAACDKPEQSFEACAPIAAACEPIAEAVACDPACAQVYDGQVYTYGQAYVQRNVVVAYPEYLAAPAPVRVRPILRRTAQPYETEITITRKRKACF